jgi:hypothetical protein
MNDRLVDHTDVLLLRPIATGRGVSLLPAVDVVAEAEGARGVVVALIFAAVAGGVEELAARAEDVFAGFRAAGMREAGVLVTLDEPNNFPRHPIRTDGPHLVWLGVTGDDETIRRFEPEMERAAAALAATGLLRGEPELVVMDPAARSRLRWLPDRR